MTRFTAKFVVSGALLMAMTAGSALDGQEAPPDVILSNGKIITVDERFTIAQAAAIRGERFIAVGANQDIARLAGPKTQRIDLRGRAVIPGLIDNHMHLLRAGATWQSEVRWDGVGSRKQALDMLRARTKAARPGEWLYSLGGWTIDQFSDNKTPFTRAELDQVAPDNPVLLQSSYYEAYLNSRGLQALGIDEKSPSDAWVVRDSAGKPTGRIHEAGIRGLAAKLPQPPANEAEAGTAAMIKDLNRAGLTAFGSAGCEADLLPIYRRWADQGRLNLRVFCITGVGAGTTPEQVGRALPLIAQMKLFQGDHYVDHVAFGESVYGPLHDPMFLTKSDPRPGQLAEWRRITTEVAKAGLPLHVHAELEDTIDAFLDQIEAINKEHPVKNLRWVLAHVNRLNASHLSRMRDLGMYAAVHPWGVINGGINQRVFGESAFDMPPLATIQNSGVTWGLGSDGSRANQILPFTTLWWAVTGKMVGGAKALRQTISREDALIAHTRKNAYLVFQENNLGSIEPGKLADLVVLDRDYLTIPAEQIKDIKPVMTMVGGRIVFDADAAAKTVQTLPRTPEGHPDLQGIWTNSTLTPLERPAEFAGKPFFTREEALEFEKQVRARNNGDRRDSNPEADLTTGYNDFWWDRGTKVASTMRTSLIVDPPDGRIPPLTPEAQKKAAARAEARRLRPADGPEDRSLADRCIARGNNGPPMLPAGYNNNYQIVQTADHVVILLEMIHDARIIPLDARPHLPGNVQQWYGDSRGRWEGNTLVVETTNFTDRTNFRGSGDKLRVVERFTRVDDETLLYQFTVEDPESFTRPWSGEIPMKKTEGPIFEYACHEGNLSMVNILSAARAEEKAAEGTR
jgi:predicted amidohydrolase YtcJ